MFHFGAALYCKKNGRVAYCSLTSLLKNTTVLQLLSASKFSLVSACILGVVSATPVARQTCNPNFEGAGVSIIANEVE
jgi:hypothetical protein